MKHLQLAISFCADESGVTAIEYALIAVLIAVAVAATVSSAGSSLKILFTSISTCFSTPGSC